MSKVKEKTLRKIEDYFARETTMRGNSDVQVSLEDLRRDTKLSLVTVYKALENLIDTGKLVVIDQGTRRSPKVYRFLPGNGRDLELPPSDLARITKSLEDLVHELAVKEQAINSLRAKLAMFEMQESQVLYRLRVSEDVEVIVRKKTSL